MKKSLVLVALVLMTGTLFSQEQEEEPFSYQVNGLVYVNNYDRENRETLSTYKIPKEGLKFKIVGKNFGEQPDSSYYIIRFFPIIKDIIKAGKGSTVNLEGDTTFVNSNDNDKFFWIKKEEFDNLLADGFIKIRYQTGKPRFTYAASLSLPFKYRPETNGQNAKITPDITLGGYFGFRCRVNNSKPYYLSLPVVTLGMTTLSVNDNNNPSTPSKGDGLVLGITASLGLVLQFNEFQIGVMAGIDRAGGELGKDWIYNDKCWYSFSIGYNFFGKQERTE